MWLGGCTAASGSCVAAEAIGSLWRGICGMCAVSRHWLMVALRRYAVLGLAMKGMQRRMMPARACGSAYRTADDLGLVAWMRACSDSVWSLKKQTYCRAGMR
jgi:hypothetical protein